MFLAIAVILLAGIALVSLGVTRHDFFVPVDVPWMRDIPIAHRGLFDAQLDENSTGAILNAIRNGYAVELDLRCTKDGVPVVIHDNTLKATFGLPGRISGMTLEEVSHLRLPKSGEGIPTLQDILDLVDGRVPLLIEIKHYGFPGRFEEAVLAVLEGYRGDYALQCYNPLVCRWLRKRAPGMPVGLLLNDLPGLHFELARRVKDNLFSAICRPNFLTYNFEYVSDGMLDRHRSNGLVVLGFGLDSTDLASGAFKAKVDNIIFELAAAPP